MYIYKAKLNIWLTYLIYILLSQELYKKFRGILNKLTPQKFDALLDKVKTLEINTQSRLEGVINLVFEKAIDEPNFSKAYATMCSKLSMIKVWINILLHQLLWINELNYFICMNMLLVLAIKKNQAGVLLPRAMMFNHG